MIALRPGSGPDGVLIVPPAPLVALPSPVRRDSAAECEPGRCPAGPFGQKDSQLFRTDRGATVRIRPALTICAQPDMLTVTVTMWPRMDAAMPKKQTTAGKKARAGDKDTTALRRQVAPGTGSAAVPSGSGTDSP